MTGENQDEAITYTLWGEPVYREARKRGRPPFEWTEENSHKVSMLLAMGWSNDRIAGCILDPRTGKPISVPTLKRHFRSELNVRRQARDLLFAKQLGEAMKAASAGNVGAMRFVDQLIEKNDRMSAEAAVGRVEKSADDEAPRLGKKQLDAQAAETADASLEAELELEARGRVRH